MPGERRSLPEINFSSVVPATAETHMPRPLDRSRAMGPGARSQRSLGRDDELTNPKETI